MDEENSIGGRVKRYAHVTQQVGSLAAKMATQRLFSSDPADNRQKAVALKNALGSLKGPIMKIAQLLSTIPDALPPEFAEELSHLQSQAPSMGWPFVKRRMTAELGPDWQEKFAGFDHHAVAAASLGQVHRATSLDGQLLACKLQYPDMSSVVQADLSQLKLMLNMYDAYDKAINSSNIIQEISSRLLEELDYRQESKHLEMYSKMLNGESYVKIPKVFDDLSTGRLLTMSWLDGDPLMTAKERPLEERNQIARNMFRAWYIPFYKYGIIHGDPHLGNYKFSQDGTVNLLDFGCVRVFPPSFVKGVIDLYFALRDGNNDLAVSAYESWGFTNISKELIEVLNGWAGYLYAPLMDNRVRAIDETGRGFYGREVASKVHDQLLNIGGVTPPSEFVFMDRAAIGLGSVFLHLKAELNWYNEFHDLIKDFNVEDLEARQKIITS